jgi:uncharacterized protein YggL (DUF469 family)
MRLHEIAGGQDVHQDPLYQKHKTAIDFAINKYLATKSAIYKGSRRSGAEGLLLRDPMGYPEPRRSKNTLNYYTEWVDHSPQWAGYPKRSRSLICTSNSGYAAGYGDVRVVVPTRDTAIGICPGDDWWTSFKTTSPQHDPDEINRFIHDVLKDNGIFLDGKTVTYDQFAQHLHTLDLGKYDASSFTEVLKDEAMKLGGIAELMDHVFDPGANGFNLTTWRKFSVTGDHEVWLSAPCVMIPRKIWQRLVDDQTEKISRIEI